METFYRLLYSMIGVQWRSFNMMADTNLLHYIMDRELVVRISWLVVPAYDPVGVHHHDLHRQHHGDRPQHVFDHWIHHQIPAGSTSTVSSHTSLNNWEKREKRGWT